jgi:hypothetical protein
MSYIALATITLTGTDSEILFSSIPTSVNGVALRDLVIVGQGTGTGNAVSSIIRFNGDTGNNYSEVAMYGLNSGSAASYGAANIGFNQGLFFRSTPGVYIMHLMDYSATNKNKTFLSRMDVSDYASFSMAGRYASNSAITSISLAQNGGPAFASGCTFSLFGIAG